MCRPTGTPSTVFDHVFFVTNIRMPACFCGLEMSDVGALQEHQESRRHFYCHRCRQLFDDQDSLMRHWAALHSLGCGSCAKTFRSSEALEQHQGATGHCYCHYCLRHFIFQISLEQHQAAVHSFECDTCYEVFPLSKAFEQHQVTREHCYCRPCNQLFHYDIDLQHHRADVHSPPCLTCHKVFSTLEALEKHQEVAGHCYCCGCRRFFGNEEALGQHLRSPIHATQPSRFQVQHLPDKVDKPQSNGKPAKENTGRSVIVSVKVLATRSLKASVKESDEASLKLLIEATVKKSVMAPVEDLGKTTVNTASVKESDKASLKLLIEAAVKKSVMAPVKDLGKTTVKKETPAQHPSSKVQKSVPNPISDMELDLKNKLNCVERNEESINEDPLPHHLRDTTHKSPLDAASQVESGSCNKGTIDISTLPESQASPGGGLTGSVACIGSNRCAEHFTTLSAMFLHLESGACCSGIDRHALSTVIRSADHGNANPGINSQHSSLNPLRNHSSLTGSLIGVQTDNLEPDSSGCSTPPSPDQQSSTSGNLPLLYGGTKCIVHDYALGSSNNCPHCQETFDTSHTFEQDLI